MTGSVLLIDKKGKKLLVNTDNEIHTQYGVISAKDINKPNLKVKTHKGYEYCVMKPGFLDLVENMKMGARPIYPYDSGIICALLSIKNGTRVLEAGTGSGGFTTYLAELGAVVDSFEEHEPFFKIAQKNLCRYENVTLTNKSVLKAKSRKKYDVIFLDLKNPAKAIEALEKNLSGGGFVGVYSPIMDDIKPVWRKLESLGFYEIRAVQLDLKEVIVKKYARVKGLLGFPGYFIWARKMQ